MEKKMDIERRVYSAEEIQEILGIKRSATYNYLTKVYTDGGPFLVQKSVPCTVCQRKILMPGCVAKRNKKFEKSLEKAADYAEKSFEKVVCDD